MDSIATRFYIFIILFGLFFMAVVSWSIYKISYEEIKSTVEYRLISEGKYLVEQFLKEVDKTSSKQTYQMFLDKLAKKAHGYALIFNQNKSLVLASSNVVSQNWKYIYTHAHKVKKVHPYAKDFHFQSFYLLDDPVFHSKSVGVVFEIKGKYKLAIAVPSKQAFAPVSNIMNRIFIAVGFVILVFLIISYFIINKAVIFPLKSISSQLRIMNSDIDSITTVKCEQKGEIGELVEALNTRTKFAKELYKEIEFTQKEIIFTMGAIAESRSKETANHVKRVASYSYLLAKYYGLSQREARMLQEASPMHDIGKVAIPDAVLKKPGKLDQEEFKLMQSHTVLGYEMLKYSKRELLQTAAIVAYEHHEKWDGSGYPRGLKAEEIHIYGRITAVADVFDALGSDRVYKKAWEDEKIFKLFQEEKGKHFDPKLIDVFFLHVDEFLAVREKLKDTF